MNALIFQFVVYVTLLGFMTLYIRRQDRALQDQADAHNREREYYEKELSVLRKSLDKAEHRARVATSRHPKAIRHFVQVMIPDAALTFCDSPQAHIQNERERLARQLAEKAAQHIAVQVAPKPELGHTLLSATLDVLPPRLPLP